jgi:hypothetical protein
MENQPAITENMRAILMDWLIEIHNKFQFRHESLYITKHIIDNFLSENMIETS